MSKTRAIDILLIVLLAAAFGVDACQHVRSAKDRGHLNDETRITQNALDARGNLYRWTLDWQIRESGMTSEQAKVVNDLARAAGLPERTTIPEDWK